MAEKITKQARVGANSMKFLDGVSEDDLKNFSWIPEGISKTVIAYVRDGRKTWDWLSDTEDQYDKSSDEHIAVKKEKEHIAKTFINVRKQIDAFKAGIGNFKSGLSSMSEGTQDSSYFMGSAVYGNQFDEFHIDKDGMFNFLVNPEEMPRDSAARKNYRENGMWSQPMGGSMKLNDVPKLIKEPFGQKSFVFKLAEKTKIEKDSGKSFDDKWTYNSVLNNLAEAGPNATIGMAFADLAGDGQTKSFAKMYEEGMKEEYYTHPDTGETLPEGTLWMKDPANAEVVSKVLSRYITNVMKDIHGPVINEDTGQIAKSQSQLAQDLIKKYSHSTHKGHK